MAFDIDDRGYSSRTNALPQALGNSVWEQSHGDEMSALKPAGVAIAQASNNKSAHENCNVKIGHADVIAAVFYRKYCAMTNCNSNSVRLTGKELQVLKSVSRGEAKRSIAESMGVTNHAVDFHYRNIMKKYQVNKGVVAVVKAIKEGVI